MLRYIYFIGLLITLGSFCLMAQEAKKPVAEMSKEELLELSYDNLLLLPFEDLILVGEKLNMSSDELIEFFLNKDVTSASKRAEKSINSPLSTTVLSRDEIINSGATSIPEALRLVPGVIVRQKTAGNYDVHIRGNDNLPPKGMFVYSENSITLVMIDGRPVYNYAFGGTFWETLPIDLIDVESIEVIRGPASALYGPNAVSGAINIITRKVEENKPHADGQVQLGTNNSKLAAVSLSTGVANKLKVRLSGNYSHFDRTEDEFYVFDYGKKYSPEQAKTLTDHNGLPIEANFDASFPEPNLGLDKYAGNAFLNYIQNEKIGVDLSLGAQQSKIISSSLGNNATPFVGRTSSTYYTDFRARVYGFSLQANYMGGDQDMQKAYPGFHIEPKAFNSSLEFEQAIGTLVLRPGISYQSSTYNDEKWVDISKNAGFLNGPQTLSSFAYYLRADYKLFEKLRVIAAVRGDMYNKPEVTKFTYQFIASYDLNENNVVRAQYSRANRGPFMADTYADYYWQIVPNYYTMFYEGNQNMKLPTMDMFEIGYRTKIAKRVMLEIEAFHTVMKDLTFYTPDSDTLFFNMGPITRGLDPETAPYKVTSHGQYQNLDLTSKQNGITITASMVINKSLSFKVFGTYQNTQIDNYYPRTIFEDLALLQQNSGLQYMADLDKIANGDLSPLADTLKAYSASISNISSASNVSMKHEATPDFYGGFTLDYNYKKKLLVNTSFYFYTEQVLLHNRINDVGKYNENKTEKPDYDPADYAPMYTQATKVIVNLKVSYKIWRDNAVFVNARNLLNNTDREFGYMDKVDGLYLLGLDLKF